MKPFDRLTDYLSALERRLRWLALSRGVAVSALPLESVAVTVKL